jgi:hypothetical protein
MRLHLRRSLHLRVLRTGNRLLLLLLPPFLGFPCFHILVWSCSCGSRSCRSSRRFRRCHGFRHHRTILYSLLSELMQPVVTQFESSNNDVR